MLELIPDVADVFVGGPLAIIDGYIDYIAVVTTIEVDVLL